MHSIVKYIAAMCLEYVCGVMITEFACLSADGIIRSMNSIMSAISSFNVLSVKCFIYVIMPINMITNNKAL